MQRKSHEKPGASEQRKSEEWSWQYRDQNCNGMERRCEELSRHGTVTAGMAAARHRGEPLRLRCDKESEGYARTCKRHCPQGNEMDATEKYSPALAKSRDKKQGLGHAKDCIGVDMQGLLRNGRDRTSTGKEAHWRAMEVHSPSDGTAEQCSAGAWHGFVAAGSRRAQTAP